MPIIGSFAGASARGTKSAGGPKFYVATGGTITGIIYYYVKDQGKPGESTPELT